MSDLAMLVLSKKGVYNQMISDQQSEIVQLRAKIKELSPPEPPKIFFEDDEDAEDAVDAFLDELSSRIEDLDDYAYIGFMRDLSELQFCGQSLPGWVNRIKLIEHAYCYIIGDVEDDVWRSCLYDYLSEVAERGAYKCCYIRMRGGRLHPAGR